MKVGVFYFPADYGINIAELAKALEDRGFDSLFVPEHTHIPLSRKSPFPGGGELPKRYSHTHDPFVALSFAAAATKRLKVGTGILPGAAARADRDRQVDRQPRPALGRPLHLRHRRRLERGRDEQSRRPVRRPLQPDGRLREGHEDAVDQGRGRPTTASSRSSIRSGRGPSRIRSRIRRSSWAARATTRCAASSTIATAGCRAPARASTPGNRSSACTRWRRRRAAIPRRCRSPCSARRPSRRRWPTTPRPASTVRCWRSPTTAATTS